MQSRWDRIAACSDRVVEFLNPTLTWRILLAAGLFVVVGGWTAYRLADPVGFYARRESIASALRAGLTRAEVIRLLGEQPVYSFERRDAPADYYVAGWARRERPITGSVLIFMFGEPICYVWFDEQGHLEEFFVGGS